LELFPDGSVDEAAEARNNAIVSGLTLSSNHWRLENEGHQAGKNGIARCRLKTASVRPSSFNEARQFGK
jgi:hypothetical protein